MQKRMVAWKQYRDESKRPLLEKLKDLVRAYRDKTSVIPTHIGLPAALVDGATIDELRARFEVSLVVPNWAQHEIWLGVEVGDASL